MRVGFDTSTLHAPHSLGVRRVARALLEQLEERGQLEPVRLDPPAGARLSTWRQIALPREVKRQGLHGLHSFTSAFALRGPGRRVQTLHELPWRHGVQENSGLKHRFWAVAGARLADRIICPSEHVARDVGSKKVRVIHWGVDPIFAPEPPLGTLDEPLLERYRLGSDPIVLCPGAVRSKKNLSAVIRAVAHLKDNSGTRVELVVTGPSTLDLRRDLGLASQLGVADRVSTLEEIEEPDLPGIMRLASVVAVLSPSEGFALPVIEALASGTPVLIPADTAQSEIAGAEGLIVDPDSPASVAAGIELALDVKRRLSFSLSARAEAFRWERSAAKVEALWNEIQ
jgi:glycosyltransferase involved in cell wall biosynthesis